MIEPQLGDTWDNGGYEETLFVLPFSPLLEGDEADEDEDDYYWYIPVAERRRPETPALRCPHCLTGNLLASMPVPGLGLFTCFACAREAGEVLQTDLEEWAGTEAVERIKQRPEIPVWDRGDGHA